MTNRKQKNNRDTIKIKPYRVAIFVTLFFLFTYINAQETTPTTLKKEILDAKKQQTKPYQEPLPVGKTILKPAQPNLSSSTSTILMEHTDTLLVNEYTMPGIHQLKGNVVFKHNDAILKCDSAYFDRAANTFQAFSNVKIIQGDTLTLYGDFLNYDGNSRLAKVWQNVLLENKNTTLTTDSLYYDRLADLAYYFTGGVLRDGKNTLTSIWGQYSPATKTALFKNQVVMKNPDGVLTSDTLKYYTDTSIADMVGNSRINYKQKTNVYSEKGWYDTKTERMMLLKRSLVEQKDGKTLIGDTIFYDQKQGYGEAFTSVELNDPKQKTTLYGNYLAYDEKTEKGIAANKALFVDWSNKQEKFSLTADTLYLLKDSIPTDTIGYDMVRGYRNVRFYRSDLQGVCDTLSYTSRDSVLRLIDFPIVWSDNNQLTGDKIDAYTQAQQIEKVIIKGSAIAIQRDSLQYYNQLSGKEIVALLDSGQLTKINVNGNAETIYFPKDEKTKEYIGVNKTISSFVTMFFKDKKVERILLTAATGGAMFPLKELEEKDLYLPDFHWYEMVRPKNEKDLFTKHLRKKAPKLPQSSKRPKFPSGGSRADNETDQENEETPSSRQGNIRSNRNMPINSRIRNTR